MATPILVTGAAGRVGAVGRTVTELLVKQGKAVRAMVRNEDERSQALRDMGVEVVIGDLLDLDSMHKAIAGWATMYFGMSVSADYLAATGLPVHLVNHLATMANSQRAGRYDRMSNDVLTLTGQRPLSVQDFVRKNAATFTAAAKVA
jgi:uncharacterized protein YbjT (DUF2867 family)